VGLQTGPLLPFAALPRPLTGAEPCPLSMALRVGPPSGRARTGPDRVRVPDKDEPHPVRGRLCGPGRVLSLRVARSGSGGCGTSWFGGVRAPPTGESGLHPHHLHPSGSLCCLSLCLLGPLGALWRRVARMHAGLLPSLKMGLMYSTIDSGTESQATPRGRHRKRAGKARTDDLTIVSPSP
jgi:hypothetical protein